MQKLGKIRFSFLKLERILKRLQKMWSGWRNSSKKIYFYHRTSEYKNMWQAIAEKVGARFTVLDEDTWELELNGKKTRMLNHQIEFDNPVILGMAGKKPFIHRILHEKGIPVPEHIVFNLAELDKAYEFLKRHPEGCVIKPANNTHAGDGVTTHILKNREARKAAILASLYCPDILMEPQISGECYRLLVLGGKMVHAVRRSGPRLKGDGLSTVLELINAENNSLRSEGRGILIIDRDCLFTLGWQRLSLDAIPEKGSVIIVKTVNDPLGRSAELRTVYNETVTDMICDSVKKSAELAAKILNSDFVGIDMIMTDSMIPLEQSGGIINEVNTTPALHHHYNAEAEIYPQPALQAFYLLLERAKSF